jgi:hypothetical protein
VLNPLSADCRFDPDELVVVLALVSPSPSPKLDLLPLRELPRLPGVLDFEPVERAEMVEIRRLSAGEGGAGRVEDNEDDVEDEI